jgi:hypothetical protein
MTRIHRYGDEETIVTAREKAIAALFIVGVAALLVERVVAGPEERNDTATQASAGIPVPNSTDAPSTASVDTSAARAGSAPTGHD